MIVFDTETTGLGQPYVQPLSKQPKIIEFAGIKLDDDTLEEIDRLEFICNPQEQISDKITKITGLTNDDLLDKLPFFDHYNNLVNFFIGEKSMCAHNLAFDRDILVFELQRLDLQYKFPFPYIHLCSVELTYHINQYRLNLSKLHHWCFGESFEGAHRAMVDVEALVRCVRHLRKEQMI